MLFSDAPAESPHRCAWCRAAASRTTRLEPATERQASVASGCGAGDLICAPCGAMFAADADALDEMVLDAETRAA